MRRQDSWWELKTFDEQAADIICRVIDRAHDLVAAPRAQPVGRDLDQRRGDYGIVHALKESEAADVRLMKGVIVWIIARHDSPDDLSVMARQEKRGVPVLKKGMASIEKFFAFEEKRRHPRRIALIDFPREFDEGVALRAGSDLGHLDQTAPLRPLTA